MPSNNLSNSLTCHEPFSKLDRWSLAFDGTNDYIDCGSGSTLDVGASAFSVSAWIYATGNTDDAIVSKGHSLGAGSGWALSVTSNEAIYLDIHDASNRDITKTANSAFSLNAWNHVVAVRPAGTGEGRKIYLNGSDITDTNAEAVETCNDAAIDFKIGTCSNNRYFGGKISDIAYYNVELSGAQVTSIYNSGDSYRHDTGVGSANLQGWWRMGDGTLDGYPLIADNSASSVLGTDLVTNGTFNSNTTGWSDEDSGTVSHETSIIHSGAGALRCTFDGSEKWGGKTTSDISSVQANTLYLVEAHIYIPSGFDGGDCWLTDGATFASASVEEVLRASSSITNQWQLTRSIFRTVTDTTGRLYIRSTSNPSNTKYILVDDVTMRPITGGNPGYTINMTTDDFVEDTP